MKTVGKPDAGNPHVRFDERGGETERVPTRNRALPRLYFVKLVSLKEPKANSVRWFYIPSFSSFTLKKVTAGRYEVRYRDLSNGRRFATEAFNLEETSTSNGTQYSNVTMTLYKVENGNMQTYPIPEAAFEE